VRTFPIRLRLALAFASVAALLLTAVGIFGYVRLAAGFSDDVDLELRQRAQDLVGPASRPGASLRDLSGSGFIERGESFAEIVSPSGKVLDATPTLKGQPLLTPGQARRAAGGTVTVNRPNVPGLDEPARLLATPFTRHGKSVVLVVGITRENGLEALRRVRAELLVAIPLLALLTFVGAYAVAGAALRPVELMRRRASELTGEDPALRLPIPGGDDEISRLGTTLNELLARVEDTLERERSFVAHASHELRTPLALLRTQLELALRRPRSMTELRAAIQSTATEVDRLERLSEDLLLLAQSGEGGLPVHRETVAISNLFAAVAARFSHALEEYGRGIDVVPTGVRVDADRQLLQQAMTNLVANALEHGGGTVRLDVRERESDVELVVSDRGAGVEPDLADRAQERFVRGAASSGAGLGLSIVTAIAEAHGGASGVRRAGDDTEAWVSIPRPAGARGAPSPTSTPALAHGPLRRP
jgi:signal transduction histidine kinase